MKKTITKKILSLISALTLIAAMFLQVSITAEAKNVEDYPKYWTNVNTAGVQNNPSYSPAFAVESGRQLKLQAIAIYQYNYGSGATPGTISLVNSSKATIGTWNAVGRYNNQWWDVFPDITLPAGTYYITCSSPETWSYNVSSENAGFAEVYGTISNSNGSVSKLGKPTIKSIKYHKTIGKAVNYKITWKKVKGASGYEIQAATDKKFKKGLIKGTAVKTYIYFMRTNNQKNNVKYYIRVRAVSGSKKGKWSAVKSFNFKFR